MHKGASQWKITTGESRCRENRQIGGKTWSLISSLFHLNETLASPSSPISRHWSYTRRTCLAGKKFPLC
ncbi:AVN_HP_G0119610.mRNA.1.CDS.1 [Saccharomyces cerevisiae]|nr:AVN_HP_G0119610.mRNA.1.CDS.1 [Saccharomyces cerevisiae]CAI6996746.1 AVN_HP_G0119610.mRNA.1.CDS.1 [Saccharomyces cerevisiae]